MIDQLLGLITLYGVPALFGMLAIGSAGVPLPNTLMLLAVGSFVAQGELTLWHVLVAGSVGAIIGDQVGYIVGRFGGRRLVRRITDKVGGTANVKRSEEYMKRWGGYAIFFTRWLVGPLGFWINLSSGIAEYPWRRFIVWDILGEILWVCLYVSLGWYFSDRVQYLADLLGDLTWVIVGLLASTYLGWRLLKYFRSPGVPPKHGNSNKNLEHSEVVLPSTSV